MFSTKTYLLVCLLALLAVGGLTVLSLLSLYGKASGRFSSWLQRRLAGWEVTLERLGGFRWDQFVIASTLSLFFEMLMIRWISSEITVFAYFKNFVLISCFLGFGIGCYFAKRAISLVAFLTPLLFLAILVKLPWPALQNSVQHLPSYLGVTSETFVWDAFSVPFAGYVSMIIGIALITVMVALITFLFIPMGQLVGGYLEQKNGEISAYTVNVLASLAGILLYTVLCFWFLPPVVWFTFAGGFVVFVFWRSPKARWATSVVFLACLSLLAIPPAKPAVELWSPYQKITLMPHPNAGAPISWELQTNNSWHQEMFDLSPQFAASHPDLFNRVPLQYNAYNIPYHFYPKPASVLVLGAGSGNDVAAALRNGANRVVAVEIDPLILQLGSKLHFEKPYDSPRTHVILGDARSYLQTANDRFDLIVFSLLDSHTTVSYFSNTRIDNYVYTAESFRAARRLLNADGVMVVKFWVDKSWIAGRLYGLLSTTFGEPPIDLAAITTNYTTPGRFFITGSRSRLQAALTDPGLHAYLRVPPLDRSQNVNLTTDDWPNFYQRQPGLALNVIVAACFIVLLWMVFMRRTGMRASSIKWHFFFLGAGFMLLEAQIVSRMALLFGTTWLVNTVVVGTILIVVVGANVVAGRTSRVTYWPAYSGLFLCLAAGYLLPLEKLFLLDAWLRAAVAVLLLVSPIFFASLIFIGSFSKVGFDSAALGSNIFGALTGGLLELLSAWTGIRALLIIAGLLYLISSLAGRKLLAEANRPIPGRS
jgi:SAM-dependent methyltransferase